MDDAAGASRRATWVLIALALAYAFLAGFHTTDFDTGWHLATGRYVLQHHAVPDTDQFSYTARGAPWIYPPLPGVIFYLLYQLDGWSALSWLTALACVAAVGLTLRRDQPITSALAIVAVPAIAFRTVARADLFNTVCFAALLRVLWTQFRSGRARLWWIPVVMCLWANLHLGFVAGIGLLLAYAGAEALELPFAERRSAVLARLRAAWPWLAAGVAATLLNPFGVNVYRGVLQQPLVSEAWNYLIGEFARTPLPTLAALDWRNPQNSYWWVMAIAAAAALIAVARRQFGAAALLAGAAAVSLDRVRFQAMFAVVAVVVAGAVLSDAAAGAIASQPERRRTWRLLGITAVALLAALVALRAFGLVSNRYYVEAAETSLFGPGPNRWYPEGAAEFVLRERLPGKMFNEFNSGAFLMWKLGAQYPVYSDNRAMPFGTSFLFHQRWLMQQPPDSQAWDQEVEKWGINFLLLSTDRYGGLDFPLAEFCSSRNWTPVYLDQEAAVLVRNTLDNEDLVQRLRIDCATAKFTPPAAGGERGKAEQFQFYANTGAILFLLSRDGEALEALQRAQQLFPEDAGVHLSRAQLFQAEGHLPEAEREYRASLLLKETSVGWHLLGLLLASQQRWPEAAAALQKAARLDLYPQEIYVQLGQVRLVEKQAQAALEAFEKAREKSPFRGDAAQFGSQFLAQVADGEARAWTMLGDVQKAISREEEAVKLTPESAARWREMAELYQAAGRTQEAEQAREKAERVGAGIK
ncbi:MAG TPA: tetratricopeptide repeat protein [Terriglobales bacterium]|nr:tetratricopeptide repeat protein [Terriglobales bacterium]